MQLENMPYSSSASRPQPSKKNGIAAMLLAMGLFVCSDTLMKLATAAYPPGQTMAIRSLFASTAVLVTVLSFGSMKDLALLRNRRVMLRAGLEGLVAATFITSLAKLPLGNINAILQASSLIIVAMVAVLRIEVIGWRRWTAVAIGFVGVLLIVRPSADGFNVYALLALASAILVAVRDLVTRSIGKDISSGVVTLATTISVGIAGVAMLGYEIWQPLVLRETLFLLAAAGFVAGGNFAIIVAFRSGDVSLVSGFRYSILVFSIIAGFLIWGEVPDLPAIVGSALIVGSGLYALHRQRLRERLAKPCTALGSGS